MTLHQTASAVPILHFALSIFSFALRSPLGLVTRLILAFTFVFPAICIADSQPQFVSIRVGFGNQYKTGLWTPVEVVLQGGDQELNGRVSLVVPDGDGVPSRVTAKQSCQLPTGNAKAVQLLCRFGRVHSRLTAEYRVDGRVVAQRTFETAKQADFEHFLPSIESRKLIVTYGAVDLSLDEVGKLSGVEPEYRPVAGKITDPLLLPDDWLGYEGVDAVMLATDDSALLEKLAAATDRIAALDTWIQQGGRLVFCVGANAESVLPADSPLTRFLPGKLSRIVPLRQAGALESYCGSRVSIPQQPGSKDVMRVPQLSEVQGMIEAHEADLPLVIRKAHGFGQIIFLAGDLNQPAILKWIDRPMLIAKLLDMPLGHSEESEGGLSMMHFGFNDMAGQLRSVLEQFDDVSIAPFWFIAAIIIVYLLLIGPGDYFLLRGLGRMTLTWATFPLLVLIVSVGAFFLAYHLKGDRIRICQAELIDTDTVSGRIRATTWVNVFSPRTELYNLSVAPQLSDGSSRSDAPSTIAWFGLPGSGLGGMNPRMGDTSQWMEPYDFAPSLNAMFEMPIQVWATKSLTARWNASTTVFPQAELQNDGQMLLGTLTNSLGFPLEQCLLAYDRSVYDLGTIGPGEIVRIGAMTKRSELKTLLTGRRIIADTGDKFRQEATPYDQSSTDISLILRTMMFYDAAGGYSYTGLWNDYQGFIDFSSLLHTGRAILIAQQPAGDAAKYPGTTLLNNSKPIDAAASKRMTMYRFVYPVKKVISGQ